MATYQNIFTQVQVQGPPEMGVPHLDGSEGRIALVGHNYWMGKLGQAQIGPVYLGLLGTIALAFGSAAFLKGLSLGRQWHYCLLLKML